MPLRQAAALHHARYRGGFHSATSLAAAQQKLKFVPHNRFAICHCFDSIQSIFTYTANIAHTGIKIQGYIKRAVVFCFLLACPPLSFYPATRFWLLNS